MMKNMKRHTKSVISIVLALVLIVSTVAVGIIATNAAYLNGKPKSAEAANAEADVADANAVGAKADDTASVGAKAPEAVGANVDSDSVGWTSANCLVRYKFDGGDWQNANMNSSGIMSITTTKGGTLEFALEAEGWWYKGKEGQNTISSVTTNSSANYYAWYENSSDSQNKGDRNYTVTLPSAGTYNFSYETRTKKGEQENAELQFHFWKTNTSYTISYGSVSNGSFTTAPTSANSGNTVTVVATPAAGYQLATFTVKDASNNTVSTSGSGNTRTFTMPSANVTVNATFTKASYTITANASNCTVTGFTSPAEYGSTVNFTVTPNTDYALKTLTVKQGSTNVSTTKIDDTHYSFTMPAGAVTITATCATTSGTAAIYFKSATAWVYHPFITVNNGAEQEMTLGATPVYLTNGSKADAVKPFSATGSLRYAWYKIDMTGIDTSKPVTIKIRGKDTYMEAEGTFTIGSGDSLYLACDNLMEGSTLVDLSSESDAVKDFYDTPLHMVATAAEKEMING